METQAPQKKHDEGGAGWIVTFADLMSLLMCFFVLLLSFSELDLMKFKAIAGSMRLAFGVQREVAAPDIPMGTSIIAQEFSAGKPTPTPLNEVRQKTTEIDKQTLEFTDALVNEQDGQDSHDSDGPGGVQQADYSKTRADAEKMIAALKKEVEQGLIQVETEGASIVVRINEKGSFPSGTADFAAGFIPVINKLKDSLMAITGTVVVAGHTDDVPIKTARFRSNWDLSAARAVTVVHELLAEDDLDAARFVVEGHADAHPLVPNDSAENRAINRRVELTIRQAGNAAAPVEESLGTVFVGADEPTAQFDIIRQGVEAAMGAGVMTNQQQGSSDRTNIDEF